MYGVSSGQRVTGSGDVAGGWLLACEFLVLQGSYQLPYEEDETSGESTVYGGQQHWVVGG